MLKNKCTLLLSMLCLGMLLTACDTLSTNGKESERQGLCRDLKAQQVFGGLSSPNKQSLSWQQRAEGGRIEADYRKYGCS
jgi:hypothetical protein